VISFERRLQILNVEGDEFLSVTRLDDANIQPDSDEKEAVSKATK